jgi:Trichohyalin-plectin-homology domain
MEQFKKEEMERRKVDEEEAEYRSKLRADTILQANQKIFMEHDKVKSMQTKLLLSDALKERELQMDIMKRKQALNKEIGDAQHQDVMEWCQTYDENEATQAANERVKKADQQKVLKKQHEEFIQKRVNRLREEKVEGQIVKIKAEEAVEEEKKAEQERKNKLLRAQADTKKANEELEKIREELRRKEKLEDEKIEEFRRNKEEMLSLRAQREKERFQEKQAIRQKIIDAQIENLKRIKNREDEILNKQIKEAEIKAEEIERIKKEKRDALKVKQKNLISTKK